MDPGRNDIVVVLFSENGGMSSWLECENLSGSKCTATTVDTLLALYIEEFVLSGHCMPPFFIIPCRFLFELVYICTMH